jgi:hypothetical protein
MRKSNLQLLLIIFLFLASNHLFSSSTGKTGITETGCYCHGTLSDGNSDITLLISPESITTDGYTPEAIYTVLVGVSGGPDTLLGGFNVRITGGSFLNPGPNVQVEVDEVTHTNKNARSWSFQWQAPSVASEPITFYYCGNAVNGDGYYYNDDPTEVKDITFQPAVTSVYEPDDLVVKGYRLDQNYPNPFNAGTRINYYINKPVSVSLGIYDLTGKLIYEVSRYHAQSGPDSFFWNGQTVNGEHAPSGVYIYKLMFDKIVESKKMILLR